MMKIKSRRYIHIECTDEHSVLAMSQTREAWEDKIGPGIRVGKITSADGMTALFFTSPLDLNYRIAMGVAGSYARHLFVSWDIPF